MTPELIAKHLAAIPTTATDDLAHGYKCLIIDPSTANRKLTEHLAATILKELRARTKVVITESLPE